MDFRVLGPVEMHDLSTGARIVPSGAKQRALLGAFVVRAGEVLSADRLIGELWGDTPPPRAANALQAHVARLRRLLRNGTGGREWITTESVGYLLHLGDATTDAERFRRLSAQGRAAFGADPERAAGLLRRALALWRGPALEGSVGGPICSIEADRLEDARLTVLEGALEAAMRGVPYDGLIDELERLARAHPTRERFCDLLMTALHRHGRRTEALGVYERTRQRLLSELGVEPGPALRGRMESILHHAPAAGVPIETSATFAPDATFSDLGAEIVQLRAQVACLTRHQEVLARRFDRLYAAEAAARI
ncbi:hypothetical protein BGK72_38575 [Streptomyces agglomeratus]|nr:hypothetical protein BGK72_38575 [Streptomyces agglomeratus]